MEKKEKKEVDRTNRKNTTHHKEKQRFLRGKTKHLLLISSAILFLTCILTLPLASGQNQTITIPLTCGQIQTNTLPQINNANTKGDTLTLTNQITLGSIITNGMSLVGSMTTIGDTELNGLLNISSFDQLILGPLITNGTQNITADKIEIIKPTYAGNTITLTGTPSNPTIVNICGNIIIGKEWGTEPTAYEISMNITNFYQYVESHSAGWIGDYLENGKDLTNDLPLNTKDAIKVHQGTLYLYGTMLGMSVYTTINSTHFNLSIPAIEWLWGGPVLIPLASDPYFGWANVSRMKSDNRFPLLLSPFIGEILNMSCMYWIAPVTFEAKGPWFALGNGGGIITMYDTYTQIISNDTMIYTFLGDSPSEAGFRVNSSANYPKATMNITTQEQVVNGQGRTYITCGSIILTGITIKNENQIINAELTFQGNMVQQGNIKVQGNIGISGHSYMQGLITVQGDMNINDGLTSGKITLTINGVMETAGSMDIIGGEINVPSGSIVMNDTGSFITGDIITVTGSQITSQGTTEVNGDTIMKGDFTMGGTSYIKGPVSITGALNINSGTMTGTGIITVSNGYMQTVGNMSILNGTVTVSGKIVMDSSGTYIGSETSITGDSIAVTGTVTNAGSVKMTGTFMLLVPMSMTGVMVTSGITAMGGLGTITGVMNIMGNIIMSGMTVISGDNNIMGSMMVTPFGVAIYGVVGLTGVVYTSSMPSIGPTTILELLSGSMMGLPLPHVSILMNPLALVALGILGLGTVYVVSRTVYLGIKERRTLAQRARTYGREVGRIISGKFRRIFRGSRG